jgi:probable HAF family extracellular repeat protein
MNDRGDSVGSFNDINLTDHGFVRSSGIFRTVDVPDGQNTFPLGINASGKIVGLYTDSTGQQHSFIAQPGNGSTGDADRGQAAATSANIQSQQRPDCKNEQWQRRNAQLRNSGTCQVKQ